MKSWKKMVLGVLGGLIISGICCLGQVKAETTIAAGPVGDSEQERIAKALRTRLNTDGSFNIIDYKVLTYINDTTPDVSTGCIVEVGSNTGTTTITDLDNPVPGSIVILIIKGGANYSTITDGGNFALAGNWSPNSADDNITLYIQADNDYIEITRANN